MNFASHDPDIISTIFLKKSKFQASSPFSTALKLLLRGIRLIIITIIIYSWEYTSGSKYSIFYLKLSSHRLRTTYDRGALGNVLQLFNISSVKMVIFQIRMYSVLRMV